MAVAPPGANAARGLKLLGRAQVCSARGTNSMDDDSSLAWLSDVMWLLEADDEDAEADFSLFTDIRTHTASSIFFYISFSI